MCTTFNASFQCKVACKQQNQIILNNAYSYTRSTCSHTYWMQGSQATQIQLLLLNNQAVVKRFRESNARGKKIDVILKCIN